VFYNEANFRHERKVMSASAIVSPDLTKTEIREQAQPAPRKLQPGAGWNPENFAQEQIRGLVRAVFHSGSERPVRQVVFSSVEPETDVRSICRRVGEVLAVEKSESVVAIAGRFPYALHDRERQWEAIAGRENRDTGGRLRRTATQLRANLWLVPTEGNDGDPVTALSVHQYLSEMRREFEYSIVAARSAENSSEAMAMAQFADGIILVLSAQHTRRATARRFKEALEASRAHVVGTVLSDRVFPIPEAIYRWL
jgi:hypothetical protein